MQALRKRDGSVYLVYQALPTFSLIQNGKLHLAFDADIFLLRHDLLYHDISMALDHILDVRLILRQIVILLCDQLRHDLDWHFIFMYYLCL